MTIAVGDKLPEANFNIMKDGVQAVSTNDIFAGKKAVLFAVPGAFTPTCSAKHLPGFVQHIDDFRKLGFEVACVSVNDAFVMDAWGKSQEVPDDIHMLADGNGAFTEALGLQMDGSAFGLGNRSKRYALIANDGVVTNLFIDAPGEFKVSSAEHVLSVIN